MIIVKCKLYNDPFLGGLCVFGAFNAVFGVSMGNITEPKVVQYDANMCHYDAKFVQYDANIVQSDAKFVPNETTDFADYADFRG
jgi:hypothetical protein